MSLSLSRYSRSISDSMRFLMSAGSTANRAVSCFTTSATNNECSSVLRLFIIRTIEASTLRTGERRGKTGNASQHQSMPVNNRQRQSTPVNASQHQSTPVNTSQCQSTPVNNSRQQSTPVNTSQHQSTPVNASQHRSQSGIVPVEKQRATRDATETEENKRAKTVAM